MYKKRYFTMVCLLVIGFTSTHLAAQIPGLEEFSTLLLGARSTIRAIFMSLSFIFGALGLAGVFWKMANKSNDAINSVIWWMGALCLISIGITVLTSITQA